MLKPVRRDAASCYGSMAYGLVLGVVRKAGVLEGAIQLWCDERHARCISFGLPLAAVNPPMNTSSVAKDSQHMRAPNVECERD